MSNDDSWWQAVTQSVAAGAMLGLLAAVWKLVAWLLDLVRWRKRHVRAHRERGEFDGDE